jgi:hypothetical protein
MEKHRYSISWITNAGYHGNSVIEASECLSDEQIKMLINQNLAKDGHHGHEVVAISKKKISAGASIASQLLITAANLFFK